MVILRQKGYARSDYKGLSDEQKEKLKLKRDSLALILKNKKREINKDYNRKFNYFFAWPAIEKNPFIKIYKKETVDIRMSWKILEIRLNLINLE